MTMFSLLYLCLPAVTAFPSYLQCSSDADSRLVLGNVMMKVPVTAAADITLEARRGENAVTSYIEGEILELRAAGLNAGGMAILRANDASNTTLKTEDSEGLWESQCQSQIHVPNAKRLAGDTKIYFRPGCVKKGANNQYGQTVQSGNLELTFIACSGPGQDVLLKKLTLTPEGKQDPSCGGGAIPTPPPPLGNDATYTALMWVHRWSVITTWGFMFPLGVSLVRYFPSGNRLKLHRTIMTTAILIELMDFICIYRAHDIGPHGNGPVSGDPHFSGVAGSSPGATHKQRGLAVFLCLLSQLLLGVVRPMPYPNNFKRRVWLWAHRTLGDGGMIIAWIQIWEAVSQFAGADQGTFLSMAIVAFLFTISAAVVTPVYCMLVASGAERAIEQSHCNVESSIISEVPSLRTSNVPGGAQENDHPRDAAFFGCAYCQQVFTGKHILEVHMKFSHPGMEYKEIISPMTQRFAEVINSPAVKEGIPLSEVRRHNTKQDCWIVLNGKVYNLTNFLNMHPGGPNPILSEAGRDASRTWNQIHQKAWIARYSAQIECLGPVGPEPAISGEEAERELKDSQSSDSTRRRSAGKAELPGELSMAMASTNASSPDDMKTSLVTDRGSSRPDSS